MSDLHAIFVLAGRAKAGESEADVTGFVDEASPRVLGADLFGSFQWGMRAPAKTSTPNRSLREEGFR